MYVFRFKSGDMSIDDKFHSGSISGAKLTKKLEKCENLCSQPIGIQLINFSEYLVILKLGVANFNGLFGMKRIAVKFDPRALTDNQKEHRVEIYVYFERTA